MDWIAIALLIIFAVNIVVSVILSNMTLEQESTKNAVLYGLYVELRRYNDNTFGAEK